MRIDWLDLARIPGLASATGRLGMTGLAGAAALQRADGIDRLVLFVEDHELAYVGVSNIDADPGRPRHRTRPPPDPRHGHPARSGRLRTAPGRHTSGGQDGRTVVAACFGGYGRTGTAIACLLVDAGLSPDEAIALTRETRPGTIERDSQLEFVRGWGHLRCS